MDPRALFTSLRPHQWTKHLLLFAPLALSKHLFDETGSLRNFVNVYVNDEDIRYLQKEQTQVSEKDTVSIIPSIAGGRS